jgi:hypothetical protein
VTPLLQTCIRLGIADQKLYPETLAEFYGQVVVLPHLATLRMCNKYQPVFTDEEVMAVYIFGIISGLSKVKPIYDFKRNHLLDWSLQLPSYQAFNYRLNQLSACFEVLVYSLNGYALRQDCCLRQWMMRR